VLEELECPVGHPMVCAAVNYLLATYDEPTMVWRVVPEDTNLFPHAPWWHDEGGSLARTFDGFQIIPRVLIVALLHHYSDLVPSDWLERLTEDTVRTIETVTVLGEGGGSDLEYAIHLARTEVLQERYRSRLTARILSAIPAVVARDSGSWDSYCITPLRAVPSPQSLGADLIPDELEANLDYEIAHQDPEGAWNPVWTWGTFYPEVWGKARQEWRGHLTLEMLTVFRAFGRIEE
jgi:hypothetical protein